MKRIQWLWAGLLALCLLVSACGNDVSPAPESSLPESYAVSETASSEEISSEISSAVLPENSGSTEIPIQFDYSACFADLSLSARHVAVLDTDSDFLLFSKGDLTEKLYPASITKLYTSYVALQYLDPETVVQVGNELNLVQPHSSLAYLGKGNRLTVETVVEGMLLPSGNDAAYVLAAAAGRAILEDPTADAKTAVGAFVERMNRHAAEDGLAHTHFQNPDGFHDNDHYTCLSDLLVIARKALQNETIRKYAGTAKDTVKFESGQSITWRNSNQLLQTSSPYYREGVIGLKTGFTDEAGSCLVSAAECGGRLVIIAVLGCPVRGDHFAESAALLDRYASIEFR